MSTKSKKPQKPYIDDRVSDINNRLNELELALVQQNVVRDNVHWTRSLMDRFFMEAAGDTRITPGSVIPELSRKLDALCKHLGISIAIEKQEPDRVVIRTIKKGGKTK